jgi:hypothetical protein
MRRELRLIADLSDARVDVTEADLLIGDSTGSTVAAPRPSTPRPPIHDSAVGLLRWRRGHRC